MVADLRRANETDRGPILVARYCFDEHRVAHLLARADIEIVDPGYTFVLAHRDVRVTVRVDVGKVKRPVIRDADGRIENPGRRAGREAGVLHRAHGPGGSRIVRNSNCLHAGTAAVRHIHSPIGRDFHVAVDSAAAIRHGIIDCGGTAEVQAAVVTARTERRHTGLRTIINRVAFVNRITERNGRGIRAGAD